MKIKITLEDEVDKDDGKACLELHENTAAEFGLTEDDAPVTFGIMAELTEALK